MSQDRAEKSICLISGNHLCHNPRVLKEAITLAQGGFRVQVLGAWSNPSLKAQDQDLMPRMPFRFTPVVDFTQSNTVSKVRMAASRIRRKVGQLAYRVGGLANRWQLGYAIGALRRTARRQDADLYIAHSEMALAVAQGLLNAGYRVGVDMEDWFSEDLLPDARRHRPIGWLSELERRLLLRGAHSSCPSGAMSVALAKEYGCVPPMVVYNAFRWSDRQSIDGQLKDRRDRHIPSIHWYSQTLGEGRGLEELLASLPLLNRPTELHLRGQPAASFERWLTEHTPGGWGDRIIVHEQVPNSELLSRIAEHDIGFAGEMRYCRSRDLTITNKTLHYLLGGLAVVASDTAGQKEVAERAPGAVHLYRAGDSADLAVRLNALLESQRLLDQSKADALRAAEKTYCWERQEPALLGSIERAMESIAR